MVVKRPTTIKDVAKKAGVSISTREFDTCNRRFTIQRLEKP